MSIDKCSFSLKRRTHFIGMLCFFKVSHFAFGLIVLYGQEIKYED